MVNHLFTLNGYEYHPEFDSSYPDYYIIFKPFIEYARNRIISLLCALYLNQTIITNLFQPFCLEAKDPTDRLIVIKCIAKFY